ARLTEAPPRSGFFERDQYEAIRREIAAGARSRDARPDLVLPITLYHEYGWRVQEVLGLETRHLSLNEGDFGSIRLDAGSTKGATMTGNGDARVVFLTAEVRRLLDEQLGSVATLQRQLGRVVPFLFPHLRGRHRGQRIGDFGKAYRSAALRAGLAVKVEREGRPALIQVHRTRHDFRRSASRNLIAAGVSEGIAMTVTGHKSR